MFSSHGLITQPAEAEPIPAKPPLKTLLFPVVGSISSLTGRREPGPAVAEHERARDEAPLVDYLPSMHRALSSNPSSTQRPAG